MRNRGVKCAERAEKLNEDANSERENLLTDSLGVLEEQGLYAFFLFLKTAKKGNAKQVSEECAKFLVAQGFLANNGSNKPFDHLKLLAEKLDDLLFARELLMQALVYARYHAKARTEGAARR